MVRAYVLLALLMLSSSIDYHDHKPSLLSMAMKQEVKTEVVRTTDYEPRRCYSEPKVWLAVYKPDGR